MLNNNSHPAVYPKIKIDLSVFWYTSCTTSDPFQ